MNEIIAHDDIRYNRKTNDEHSFRSTFAFAMKQIDSNMCVSSIDRNDITMRSSFRSICSFMELI